MTYAACLKDSTMKLTDLLLYISYYYIYLKFEDNEALFQK